MLSMYVCTLRYVCVKLQSLILSIAKWLMTKDNLFFNCFVHIAFYLHYFLHTTSCYVTFLYYMRHLLSCISLLASTTGRFQFRKAATSFCRSTVVSMYLNAWWIFFSLAQILFMIAFVHQNCQKQSGVRLRFVCL